MSVWKKKKKENVKWVSEGSLVIALWKTNTSVSPQIIYRPPIEVCFLIIGF